jgi:predicted Zn-dependent peptidase
VQFKQTQLENGLTIIAEITEHSRSMAMGFFVRTGSRDETGEISGTSHFLEHMLFKGTNQRNPMEVNLEFDRMGAQYNAFTSEENTVYYAAVLPEFQRRILTLWSDLMRPALRQEDFDTEKGVICEEIAMYKDMPHFDVLDQCRRLHFDTHGCGNSVLGTVDSIKTLQRQQMQNYFDQRYSPDNMVLAAAGKVDWDNLLDQAQQLCGQWQATQTQRPLSPFPGSGKNKTVTTDKVTRQHLCFITAGPSAQSQQRYAASLLATIIGDDTGSRLYWSLIDTALADSADMEYEPLDGTGAFYTYASCDPEQAPKIIEIINGCFEKVRREGVTENELQAAKNKIASSVTLHGELPIGRLVPLGFSWTYRKEHRSLAEELEILRAVTTEDIARCLEEFDINTTTLVGIGPCKKL